MDGFIDQSSAGVTELRVHGVSGTPPAGILNHPHPRLVAGDGTTGFYRRWWPAGRPAGDHPDVPGVRHREAYAWGNLTSGGRTIALWLLLLPFSLANLSYFMLPRPAGLVRLRHATEAAQRLFALLLTGTLVGAVTLAAVDLVGWQCTAAGRACGHDAAPVWVRWLGDMWGQEPAKRLAVTAFAPLLVVVLLWWLARRTWRRDEQTPLPPDGEPPAGSHSGPSSGPSSGSSSGPSSGSQGGPRGGPRERPLLARRRLWHGGAPVWRLRVVHVAYAIGSIGLAVSAPFAGTPAGLPLTVANAGVQLAAVVLVVLPQTARRVDPYMGERTPEWLTHACHTLRLAAPAAFLATIAAAFAGLLPHTAGRAQAAHSLAGASPASVAEVADVRLPGVGVGAFQFALTVALGVFILVTTGLLARADRRRNPGERRALGGMAAWFMLMIAAGSANVLALGLLFWTATFFGVPGTSAHAGPPGRRLFVGDQVWWTAALVPLLALGLVAVAGMLVLVRRAGTARLAPELRAYYGQRHDADRVAGTWALAALTDRAALVVAVLTGIGVAGFGAVTMISVSGLLTPDAGIAGLLASVGSWAMTAIVVGLVVLGRRTYSDSGLRRTIGILWDICTFWPRAVHPLAPPCYTERVVPELMARVGMLAATGRDQVVLSGHSQGSVIGAALALQLRPELRARFRLLTHGSPLRRLYAPFFPAYFGGDGLAAVRDAVPWSNLYRLSDPIGGPVFRRVDPFTCEMGRRGLVDRFCWDPPPPGPGEPLPEVRWHSGYWLEHTYDEELSRLIAVKPAA